MSHDDRDDGTSGIHPIRGTGRRAAGGIHPDRRSAGRGATRDAGKEQPEEWAAVIPVAVSTVDAAAGGVWTVVVAHQNNQRAVLAARGRAAWAFAATGLGAIGVATIFTGLYPRVLVSDPSFGDSVTISNAASGR